MEAVHVVAARVGTALARPPHYAPEVALLFAAGVLVWAVATLLVNVWRRLARIRSADRGEVLGPSPPPSLADEAERWLESQ